VKETKIFKKGRIKVSKTEKNISPKSKYSKNIEKNLMLRAFPS
jgi:hypothetical protein